MNNGSLIVTIVFADKIQHPIFIREECESESIFYCNQALLDLAGIDHETIVQHRNGGALPKNLIAIIQHPDYAHAQITLKSKKVELPVLNNHAKDGLQKIFVFTSGAQIKAGLEPSGVNMPSIAGPSTEKNTPTQSRLTKRELEVLNCLAKGKTIKTIAEILGISAYTVADHAKSIYCKLDVHSRSEMMLKTFSQSQLPKSK